MKVILFLVLLFILLVPASGVLSAQEHSSLEGEGGSKGLSDASKEGMSYGAILICVFLFLVAPSIGLLIVTKVIGLKEVGIIRAIYTSMVFVVVAGFLFHSAEDLSHSLMNPTAFFSNTDLMLTRAIIVFALAFVLIKFVLDASIVRGLFGSVLYMVVLYFTALLAYKLLELAGAMPMLKEGVK